MTLKERLMSDLKEAMKAKDTLLKDTIQIVRAGVLQIEKDDKVELDDHGVISVLSKELKKRIDVLPDYIKSGRQDLIDDINRQMAIIKSYLPEQLSENELEELVKDAVNETGAVSIKDIGKVMAVVSAKVKGRADNKTVSELIKKCLS